MRLLTASDDELGERPQLPDDFEPQRSAPVPLDEPRRQLVDDRDEGVPMTWREGFDRVIGPSLLIVALLVAVASCAFLGGRS